MYLYRRRRIAVETKQYIILIELVESKDESVDSLFQYNKKILSRYLFFLFIMY